MIGRTSLTSLIFALTRAESLVETLEEETVPVTEYAEIKRAPQPYFSTDINDYDSLRQPTILDFGSFPAIVTRAAWQIFD